VTGLSRRELLRRGLAAVAAGNVYALVDGLTAPPARAASMVAFSARRFVCAAMLGIFCAWIVSRWL